MATVSVLAEGIELDEPTMVEGLPGVGLVGKIAADQLVEELELTHYANVHCESLPPVVTYGDDDPDLRTPVRLYADDDGGLLVLQSDVPVSPAAATEFADCIGDWFTDVGVTPICLSGLPREEKSTPPALYGVAAGDGSELLADLDVDRPAEGGLISGPTGALLAHAVERGTTAVGLVVESNRKFPDPESARVLLKRGIGPLLGVDAPVSSLVDHATEIQEAKEELARRMQSADEESTRANPLRMYQ